MFRRYSFVRQADQSDCGAAALATVALHHRMPIGLQKVRDLAGTDRIGTNLLGLIEAAEKIGLSAKGVKGPYEALTEIPLPAIAHIKTEQGLGHFVVLHRVSHHAIIVADPARGIQKLTREQFCECWTGYLLLLTPEQNATPIASDTAPIGSWRRFLRLLSFHRSIIGEAFVCALIMTLLGLSTSYFVQHLVDSVLARHETRLLNALGIGMLLVMVFKTLFGAVRQYLLAHVSRKVDLALISGYTRHVLRLPMQFFEMRRVGEILSRTNDAAKIRQAISGTTLTAVVDAVLVVVSTVALWMYDERLALVATAFVPFLVVGIMAHHPVAKRRSREAMERAANLSAHLVEDISGVETIKAYGVERERNEEGEDRLVKVVQSGFSLQMLGISMTNFGSSVTAVAGIVILWFGGHRVMEGALSIGQLMFFYTLLGYMLRPMERLASVNLSLQDALIAVDRLYQIMDLDLEESGDEKKAKFMGVRDRIELRDVSFQYGCRENVLDNVNLCIPKGSTVAIVGESGSGKSTLLKLLMRFYDPTEGQMLIDDLDMRDIDLSSLRSRIGLVSQDPFIFNGTIYDNIILGQRTATMEQAIEAARAAGLDQFISQLPERYETVIGERGANLSGGQRQRLAIARALLRRPDILVFDEATSHLDTATERAIQQSLRSALSDKTVILVAHRLSTIREADTIYVLHEGSIVEQGRHDQLVAREGRYWDLWRAQSHDAQPHAWSSLTIDPPNGKTRHHVLGGE